MLPSTKAGIGKSYMQPKKLYITSDIEWKVNAHAYANRKTKITFGGTCSCNCNGFPIFQ